MCGTCGCGQTDQIIYNKPDKSKSYKLSQHHHADHDHDHDHDHNREISLELEIMKKNDLLAGQNRAFFEAKHILAINMVS